MSSFSSKRTLSRIRDNLTSILLAPNCRRIFSAFWLTIKRSAGLGVSAFFLVVERLDIESKEAKPLTARQSFNEVRLRSSVRLKMMLPSRLRPLRGQIYGHQKLWHFWQQCLSFLYWGTTGSLQLVNGAMFRFFCS